MAKLKATFRKSKTGKISLDITKEDFEYFCNACGLFRQDFLEMLDASEEDHREGRIAERGSLYELIER